MYPEKQLKVKYSITLEDLEKLRSKDLIFYDEHHGTAYYLSNAKSKDINRLYGAIMRCSIIIMGTAG